MFIETLAAIAVSGAAPQDIAPRGAPRGDYRQSCSGEYVNRGRLYADCRDRRNQIRETSIELNRCADYEIRNNDGLLVCGPNRGQYEDRRDDDGGWGGRGIEVFRDDDFRGASERFNGAIPDLRSAGLNDAISSMRMRGDWTACTDTNFRGQCQTFSGDVGSLRQYGMNDRISSLRPGRDGGGSDGGWGRTSITVYGDAIYRGPSETFRDAVPDLRNSQLNDRISSARLTGAWEVCSDAYYRGQCEVLREDSPNLTQWRMNDRISSMRPAGRGDGGRW